MCVSAATAALILAGTGTAVAIDSSLKAEEAGKQAKEKANRAESERKDVEAKATQNAYMQTSMSRRALRDNSLFTGGAGGPASGASGRQTMGV